MNERIRVIPIGHPEPIHTAAQSCWGGPLMKAFGADERGEILVHNAKDCREKYERQGIIDQEKPWMLVRESL